MPVRHNKTGEIYTVLYTDVIECTNGREELRYVIYAKADKLFCREQKEFWEKFTEI